MNDAEEPEKEEDNGWGDDKADELKEAAGMNEAGVAEAPPTMKETTRPFPKFLREGINDKESEVLGFKLHRVERPAGYRANFPFNPKESMIGFNIGLKGATDLCKELEYVDVVDKMNVNIGINEQQECIVNGMAFTYVNKNVVTVRLSMNPNEGTFRVTVHSYDEKAMKDVVERFLNICRQSNFYRGKHLLADNIDSISPFKFCPSIVTPIIFGFKDEQKSLNTNAVGYFECHEIHKIAPQRGILLHGRPGSGKSMLVSKTKAECLAKGITVVELSITAMGQAGRWYKVVEDWLAPALIILEDVDLVGGDRDRGESAGAVTNDFLNTLGGNIKRSGTIVTMATTNRLEALDSAFIRSRRMDKIYEINGLEPDFKAELFRRNGIKVSDESLDGAVKRLGPDTTGADVEEISISTLTYIHFGETVEDAFKKAVAEWASGHEAKKECRGAGFAGKTAIARR